MVLKWLVILAMVNLGLTLPDPDVNINVNINVEKAKRPYVVVPWVSPTMKPPSSPSSEHPVEPSKTTTTTKQPPQIPYCPFGCAILLDGYDTQYIFFSDLFRNKTQAEAKCSSEGLWLAKPDDEGVATTLRRIITYEWDMDRRPEYSLSTWIDGRGNGSEIIWSDGTVLSKNNSLWYAGYPGTWVTEEHCLSMITVFSVLYNDYTYNTSNIYWTTPCNYQLYTLCEGEVPIVEPHVEDLSDLYGCNNASGPWWTPDYCRKYMLPWSANAGNLSLAMSLIESGTDINMVNPVNRTTLAIAAHWGRASMVDLLLKNGADPSIVDMWGTIALELAEARKCEDEEYLIKGNRSCKMSENDYDRTITLLKAATQTEAPTAEDPMTEAPVVEDPVTIAPST